MPELKNCPVCGKPMILLGKAFKNSPVYKLCDKSLGGCGHTKVLSDEELTTIEAWNRRAEE